MGIGGEELDKRDPLRNSGLKKHFNPEQSQSHKKSRPDCDGTKAAETHNVSRSKKRDSSTNPSIPRPREIVRLRIPKVVPDNIDVFQQGHWKNFLLRKAPDPSKLDTDDWYFCPLWFDYTYDSTHGVELRAFGVLRDGHSCCVRIHGFMPYFFAQIPTGWANRYSIDQMRPVMQSILKQLNENMLKSITKLEKNILKNVENLILPKVCFQRHISAMGYQGLDPSLFVKIFVAYPTIVRFARIAIETPFGGYNTRTQTSYPKWLHSSFRRSSNTSAFDRKMYVNDNGFKAFDAHVDFIVRFLTDCNLPASNWWTISSKHRQIIPRSGQKTLCNVEIAVHSSSCSRCIVPELENEEPIYIDAKFDIEAASSDRFPQPDRDPVIQISIRMRYSAFSKLPPNAVHHIINSPIPPGVDNRPNNSVRVCLCLNSVREQSGFHALCYENEERLLHAFFELISVIGPDSLAGHYSNGFDFWYLLQRANTLRVKNFKFLGKVPEQTAYNNAKKESATKKGMDRPITKIPGVWVWDTMSYAQDFLYDTKSYGLNALAAHYLGDKQKLDVEYSMIAKMQETEAGRSILSAYCDRDVLLLEELDDKVTASPFIREMANLCNIPPQQVLDRASTFRLNGKWMFESQRYYDIVMRSKGGPIRQFGNQVRYLTPTRSITADFAFDMGKKYKGGSVMTPCPGFYKWLIAILDFKSLYPSVMIRYNICYLTYIAPGMQETICRVFALDIENDLWHVPSYRLTPDGKTTEAYTDLQNNPSFVKQHVLEGLVCYIERMLLAEREVKKERMGYYYGQARKATNAADRDLFLFLAGKMNLMQMAFKIVCNSMYGMLGMSKSNFPLREAAQTITKMARQALEVARFWIEENVTKAKGYPFDAQIIYGDTDSVFIALTNYDADDPSLPEQDRVRPVIPLMHEIAGEVTKNYIKPMELVFEKISVCSYMMTPKCYALRMIEDIKKPAKTKQSGTSGVRRGGCLLQRNMCNSIMKELLEKQNPNGAVQIARDTLARVMEGTVEHHEILMRSTLSKPPHLYTKAIPPHVAMAKKMMAAGDREYRAGDRVYFIVVGGPAKSKVSDRVESPKDVIKLNLPYDREYYMDLIIKESRKLLRALLDDRSYEEKREFSDWARRISFEENGQDQIDKKKNDLKKIQDKRVDSVIMHGSSPIVVHKYSQSSLAFASSQSKDAEIDSDQDSDSDSDSDNDGMGVFDGDSDDDDDGYGEIVDTPPPFAAKQKKEKEKKQDSIFSRAELSFVGRKRVCKPPIRETSMFKRFLVVEDVCENCKKTIPKDRHGLCIDCDTIENRRRFQTDAMKKLDRLSAAHQSCWTRCMQCRGRVFPPLDQEACDISNCVNYECDNWARREVVTRDVKKAAERLERISFNNLDNPEIKQCDGDIEDMI